MRTSCDILSTHGPSEFLSPSGFHFKNVTVASMYRVVFFLQKFCISHVNWFSRIWWSIFFKDRDSLLSSSEIRCFFWRPVAMMLLSSAVKGTHQSLLPLLSNGRWFPSLFFLSSITAMYFYVCTEGEKWWHSYYSDSGYIIWSSQSEKITKLMPASFRFLTWLVVQRYLFLSLFFSLCAHVLCWSKQVQLLSWVHQHCLLVPVLSSIFSRGW